MPDSKGQSNHDHRSAYRHSDELCLLGFWFCFYSYLYFCFLFLFPLEESGGLVALCLFRFTCAGLSTSSWASCCHDHGYGENGRATLTLVMVVLSGPPRPLSLSSQFHSAQNSHSVVLSPPYPHFGRPLNYPMPRQPRRKPARSVVIAPSSEAQLTIQTRLRRLRVSPSPSLPSCPASREVLAIEKEKAPWGGKMVGGSIGKTRLGTGLCTTVLVPTRLQLLRKRPCCCPSHKECDPGKESPSPPTDGFREKRVSCHSIFFILFLACTPLPPPSLTSRYVLPQGTVMLNGHAQPRTPYIHARYATGLGRLKITAETHTATCSSTSSSSSQQQRVSRGGIPGEAASRWDSRSPASRGLLGLGWSEAARSSTSCHWYSSSGGIFSLLFSFFFFLHARVPAWVVRRCLPDRHRSTSVWLPCVSSPSRAQGGAGQGRSERVGDAEVTWNA